MTHHEVRLVITDYARGRLDPQGMAGVGEHLAACAECRGALAAVRALRPELAEHGAAALSEHPTAEELAGFAASPARLAVADLARIAAHVRACPTCEREARLTRAAAERRASAGERLARAWRGARAAGPWGMLAPAAAALALLLAGPAWLGVHDLPEVRHARDTAERETATLRREVAALRDAQREGDAAASWSGGARALALPAARRGVPPAPPELRLLAGQPHLPVYVAFDPRDAGNPPVLALALLREGREVMLLEEETDALWDPALEGLSLLLPAHALSPGDFRLEVRLPGDPAPRYASAFRILP